MLAWLVGLEPEPDLIIGRPVGLENDQPPVSPSPLSSREDKKKTKEKFLFVVFNYLRQFATSASEYVYLSNKDDI